MVVGRACRSGGGGGWCVGVGVVFEPAGGVDHDLVVRGVAESSGSRGCGFAG